MEKRVDYVAVVRTSCGDFEVDLLEKKAPIAVNNFVFLARRGFYNGLIWNRLSPGQIIQAGDPNGILGIAPDGPGYTIEDELPEGKGAYGYGIVGMANTGVPDSAGSQFFVVVNDLQGAMNGKPVPLEIQPTYTVFGKVRPEFFGSLENIARQETVGSGAPLQSARPKHPIFIESIEIIER